MLKQWFIITIVAIGSCMSGRALADCGPGYYLDASGGGCTPCVGVDYYCPGDNERHDCPAPTVDNVGTFAFTDGMPADSVLSSGARGSTSKSTYSSIEQCEMVAYYNSRIGRLLVWLKYDSAAQKYAIRRQNFVMWTTAKAGYYVYNRYQESCREGQNYYTDAAECPSGAYCPGWASVSCSNNPPYDDKSGVYVCPDNTYSNAGASECTPCPAKTGNNATTIAGHAGASSCVTLCGAGATKMHAGGYEFNVWPDGKCTSPAINIGLAGGVCCVNLVVGAASGAINVQYGGKTYHTVN